MKEYFVYILRCNDGSYYTGVTHDYEKRFAEHMEGIDPSAYTHNRRPLELVYVATFWDVNEAIAWETRVKGWSRKKKEALIAREYETLPELSKRQTPFQKKKIP
jgi:putative endonuclease